MIRVCAKYTSYIFYAGVHRQVLKSRLKIARRPKGGPLKENPASYSIEIIRVSSLEKIKTQW